MVQNRLKKFSKRLRYIAIDEAFIIWGWQNFGEEYLMLGHLKDIFPTIPILILSATITPNILDYIRIFLQLPGFLQIYRQPFDRLNIRYIISPVQKKGFEDLVFLIPDDGPVAEIPKTMVFVNKIDDIVELENYLRSKLPK